MLSLCGTPNLTLPRGLAAQVGFQDNQRTKHRWADPCWRPESIDCTIIGMVAGRCFQLYQRRGRSSILGSNLLLRLPEATQASWKPVLQCPRSQTQKHAHLSNAKQGARSKVATVVKEIPSSCFRCTMVAGADLFRPQNGQIREALR